MSVNEATYENVSATDQFKDLLLGNTSDISYGDMIEDSKEVVSFRDVCPNQAGPQCWCSTEGELEQSKREWPWCKASL